MKIMKFLIFLTTCLNFKNCLSVSGLKHSSKQIYDAINSTVLMWNLAKHSNTFKFIIITLLE